MTREQFADFAHRVGYASRAFAYRFAVQSGKEEFHEQDLEDVFRAFEREKYLREEGRSHERHPLPTTKKYTVYNSHKTGGSY